MLMSSSCAESQPDRTSQPKYQSGGIRMKIRLIVRLALIALAALLQPAFASEDAEITAEAAELFEQAVAAHGGEALEQVAGYLDEGVVRSVDPMGEVFQESPFHTFVDYVNGRVRTDLLQRSEERRVGKGCRSRSRDGQGRRRG